MDEKGERVMYRQDRNGRLVYFFLGVFLAASVGLAIALGVTLANKDDNDNGNDNGSRQTATRPPTAAGPAFTAAPSHMTTTASPGGWSLAEDSPGVCITPSCVLRAGEIMQSMDKTVDPCDDFYQYACGKWDRTHVIPESSSGTSRFGGMRELVALELKGLLEKPYDSSRESNSIRKAKQMYQSCMDEEKLKEKGPKPLKDLALQVSTWPLTSPSSFNPAAFDLESILVELALLQLSPLLDVAVRVDDHNSSQYIIWIDELSLGIDRSYMLKGRNSDEVKTYEELRRQQAVHVLGLSPSTSLNNDISDVVEFEIELANMTASRAERRNLDKFYKKKTVSELSTLLPGFNWMKFLTNYFAAANISITGDTEIAIVAEDYIRSMLDLYQQTDQRIVANYLLSRLMGSYVSYLSKDIRELSNPLWKVLYGISESGSRWSTCVGRLDRYFMPTAVGQLYVSTYFSPLAKEKALEMIGYIRGSITQMMKDATWMDAATRSKALQKAEAIVQNIGYPDYQFNETVLEEFYADVDYQPDTYFQNGLDNARSNVIDNSNFLNKHPSRRSWSESASTVNAYYSASKNSITFPAGILQPPYYAEDFPMSMMFGGIGVIIGHEITHGFDDQGRKYDKEGNLRVWWSNSSTANYEQLTSCYVDQYSAQMAAGIHINGKLSLGENLADNGGIKASFTAFERWQSLNGRQPALPGLGLTHEQLFFLNYAQGWCSLMNEEALRDRLMTDPHSPATVRARVPLFNSEPFAKAYKCPVGSRMNPVKKCALW